MWWMTPLTPARVSPYFLGAAGNFTFVGFSTTTQSYALDLVSNTTLVLASPTSYERLFPDVLQRGVRATQRCHQRRPASVS